MENLIRNIRFANLNFDYNSHKVKEEILKIGHITHTPADSSTLSENYRIPNLINEEYVNNTSVWDYKTNSIIEKKYQGWFTTSLTMLESDKKIIAGSSKSRNSNYMSKWIWREDINCPYLKEIVNKLFFDTLHNVRLFILKENCVGLVHNDDPKKIYSGKHGVSVTLNIDDGGSPLVFMENDIRYDSSPKKAFMFRDDCWHGIPLLQRDRIQVKINGIPNFDKLYSLLDTNSIISVS